MDNKIGYLRNLLTKKKVENLTNEIPNIKVICANIRNMKTGYKNLIHTKNHKDVIKNNQNYIFKK